MTMIENNDWLFVAVTANKLAFGRSEDVVGSFLSPHGTYGIIHIKDSKLVYNKVNACSILRCIATKPARQDHIVFSVETTKVFISFFNSMKKHLVILSDKMEEVLRRTKEIIKADNVCPDGIYAFEHPGEKLYELDQRVTLENITAFIKLEEAQAKAKIEEETRQRVEKEMKEKNV